MVIDSSALLSILQQEPDALSFSEAIALAEAPKMSAVTKVEASMVQTGGQGAAGVEQLDLLISDAGIEIVPFDDAQAEAARDAFARFGKGRHPAGLNFGDCCVYALARVTGEPLLYKGADFAATDVRAAL